MDPPGKGKQTRSPEKKIVSMGEGRREGGQKGGRKKGKREYRSQRD